MKPNKKLITITDNQNQIEKLLSELVLQPRVNALKWSAITKQTPNIKIGYPGQHLASLITGMPGERTGARGTDLIDGTEVKSCSRIDQLDICKDCKSPVSRSEVNCPSCNSTNIKRNEDSKWLFSVKNENDLDVLINKVERIFLMIGDYPNFGEGDFSTLRFQAFEIWNTGGRSERFKEIMSNYYQKIYLAHKTESPDRMPAPKNFWPYSYQFYMCNPILTFSCTVYNADTKPKIKIGYYLDPAADRSKLESVIMPADILVEKEMDFILKNAKPKELLKMGTTNTIPDPDKSNYLEKLKFFKGIDEVLRNYLSLRDTDKIATAKKAYSRRATS